MGHTSPNAPQDSIGLLGNKGTLVLAVPEGPMDRVFNGSGCYRAADGSLLCADPIHQMERGESARGPALGVSKETLTVGQKHPPVLFLCFS